MGTPKQVAAFFDIDHTVLEINSGSKWIGYQWRTGQMGVFGLARALAWLAQYRFGWLDYEAMARKVLAGYRGKAVDPIYDEVDLWFQAEVAWAICVEAREAIQRHRDAGETLVLLSSASQFLCRPVAVALDIEHVLCTQIEVNDGVLTGVHIPPACYGVGKVTKAETFAEEHGVDLDASYFYTDSISDLPMLDRVGEPRVVNPDPRLGRVAQARGWPTETWRAPPGAVAGQSRQRYSVEEGSDVGS